MTDLRKSAEMALEALETLDVGDSYKTHNAASALRQALAQHVDAYQYEVVAEHANGTYTTKRLPKREWVGLTADEIWKCNKAKTGSAVEFHICSAHQNVLDFAEAIEAKLKEKNSA